MRFTRNRDPRGRIDQLIGVGMFGVQSAEEEAEVPFDPSQLSTPPTLWLDPVVGKVFSDTAGTVPAGNGDVVKRINGSGSTAIYADDAAGALVETPEFLVDASGRGWLDIQNDLNELALSASVAQTGAFTFWVLLKTSPDDSPNLYLLSNADGTTGVAFGASTLSAWTAQADSSGQPSASFNPVYPNLIVARIRGNGTDKAFASINNDVETEVTVDVSAWSSSFTKILQGTPSNTLVGIMIFVPANITSTTEWNNMDAYLRRIP